MSKEKSSPAGRKKGAARISTLKKPADKKQARKRNEREVQSTKRVPEASKKVKGPKPRGNGMPMKRKDDSNKTRGGGVVAHKNTRKVASTSAASVTLDAGPSRAALDDDRFLERLVRIDQRLERIEDLLQRKAQASPEHAAKACSSRECSEVDTQKLKHSVDSEPVHEFDDDYEQQPLQAPSTNGQSNESQQAPAQEPDDEFDEFDVFHDEIASQPTQKPSTKGQANETKQAPAPKLIDKLAATFQPRPPQKLSTKGQSNETKQAPAPKSVDKFDATVGPQPPKRPSTKGQSNESQQAPAPEPFDEFAEAFEPLPPQTPSANGHSNESKQAPNSEPFDEFAEAFEPKPPERPSTNGPSNESKQAPDPEPKDEFVDVFAEFNV